MKSSAVITATTNILAGEAQVGDLLGRLRNGRYAGPSLSFEVLAIEATWTKWGDDLLITTKNLETGELDTEGSSARHTTLVKVTGAEIIEIHLD